MRQKGFLALPARTLRFFSMTAFVAGLCVFAAALFSCSNLGGDFSGPAMFPDVQLGGTVIPAAIAQGRVTGTIDESGGISKSVVPDASAVQTSVQSYTVKAWGTKADGTAVPEASAIMASVNFSAKTFSINLDYGTWTIRADGYDGPGATGNIVLTQTTATPIELSSDNPVVSLNFALDYPKIAGQKGALALDFVCSTSGIIQIAYTLTDSAVPPNVIVDGIEQNHSGFTGSWTLSAASTGEAALATLEPGDYQLVVEFRAGDGSTILRLDQIVQIYSNITTTKIDGVAPYINAGGAIDITDDVVKKYQQSVVYVGGTGFKTNTPASDSNNGTQFDPVEHFERAIQIINGSSLTSSDIPDGFKVYVQDNLTLAQDVLIAGSKKITVIGTKQTAAPYKIDGSANAYNLESSASDLNFSYINFNSLKDFIVSDGQTKLNNCKITGGKKIGGAGPGAGCGGGLYVKATGKAVLANSSISGCQADYGGAIYVNYDLSSGSGTAQVELNNCLIGAESSSTAQSGDTQHSNSAQSGGGIYVGQEGKLTLAGSNTISYNYASVNGGGVYISASGDNEIAGAEISNNAAAGDGGGLYIVKNLAMESGTISGNTASSGNGGGVYINNLDAGGGTTYVGEFEISGDATVPYGTGNDVFAENAVTIGGDLTSAGIVGKIRLRSTDYVSGRIVLKDGAGAVADNYTKFAVANDPSGGIWKISDTGYIYQAGTGGGGITIYDPSGKLGFTLDKTSILGSGTVKVTAVDPTNGDAAIASSELSGWSISAYYGTDAIKTVTTNQYEFTTAYPVGSYTLNVSVTYKGTTYSDAFTVTKSYAGSKAPGAALAVGDIVFADGSATPYSSGLTLTADQKSAAIAVIFYKGTSSDPLGARTLGVGLKIGTNKYWCTTSGLSQNKNVTDIQCTASGSAGNYSFTGDIDGSDNLAQIGEFLTSITVANDTTNSGRYTAFWYAKDYKNYLTNIKGTSYESGWWLPSIAELYQVYKNVSVVNSASTKCGGNTFTLSGTPTICVSSSQSVSDAAAACKMSFDGTVVETAKTTAGTAVAIRQF